MTAEKSISTKSHFDHIDYLKAIAACFVVIGHCMETLKNEVGHFTPASNWTSVLVSSVHVPLFFVIAGYLCHSQPYGKYVMKKITRILVPYFTFAVLKMPRGAPPAHLFSKKVMGI